MISEELFNHVLLDPARKNAGRKLLIVSGFATANMAGRHLSVLKEKGLNISVSLIVGMAQARGIEKVQHTAFKNLMNNLPDGLDFECQYVYRGNPIHAKTYLWIDKNGVPKQAFCGSANYTMTGFGKSQTEAIYPADPVSARAFYDQINKISASCLEDTLDEVAPLIRSTEPSQYMDSVILPLVAQRTGKTHLRSGLNWGQRPGRNQDQAYIPIPRDIRQSDFFPPRGEQFTVLTDDGFSFIFVRAQDGAKALQTTFDNSEIGRYIRQRLGIPLGTFMEHKHLLEYGRLDIRFFKIDNETYLLDFHPNLEPGISS